METRSLIHFICYLFIIFKLSDSQPRIIGGLPWDTPNATFDQNRIEILGDAIIKIYGENLNEIQSLEITMTTFSNTEDCNSYRIPYSMEVLNISRDGHFALIFPKINKLVPYDTEIYLCVKSKNIWYHQNNSLILSFKRPEYKLPTWALITILIALLGISGLYSGLNLGLMGLTPRELDLIKASGTPKEREYAEKIYPIRKKGNVLLCSILIGITIFNASSTVILDELTPGMTAVAISTVSIVLFCELLPQSICSRYGLYIGAQTTFITQLLIIITFPISYPLGKLLDLILGHETPSSYNRNQLLEVFKLNKEGSIEKDEVCIFLDFNYFY